MFGILEKKNSKQEDWAKTYRAVNFLEKGVCTYNDEVVYLSQETLASCARGFKGRPVIIKHQRGITPENMKEHAVGYVTNCEFDQFNASFSCDFVIFDDEAKKKIAEGWSVSCAYVPTAFAAGGTWHNTTYDREITALDFTHLALVPDPRYEEAKVYENAKFSEEDGRWITINSHKGDDGEGGGTHIFIKNGETLQQAMDRQFGKKETKKPEPKKKAEPKAKKETKPAEPKKGGIKEKYGLSKEDLVGVSVALAMQKKKYEDLGNKGVPAQIDEILDKIKKGESLSDVDVTGITTSLDDTNSDIAKEISNKFKKDSNKNAQRISELENKYAGSLRLDKDDLKLMQKEIKFLSDQGMDDYDIGEHIGIEDEDYIHDLKMLDVDRMYSHYGIYDSIGNYGFMYDDKLSKQELKEKVINEFEYFNLIDIPEAEIDKQLDRFFSSTDGADEMSITDNDGEDIFDLDDSSTLWDRKYEPQIQKNKQEYNKIQKKMDDLNKKLQNTKSVSESDKILKEISRLSDLRTAAGDKEAQLYGDWYKEVHKDDNFSITDNKGKEVLKVEGKPQAKPKAKREPKATPQQKLEKMKKAVSDAAYILRRYKDSESYWQVDDDGINIRDFGSWENPDDAEDEEDYDWQVPTERTKKDIEDTAKRLTKETGVEWTSDWGEKNWVYFQVKDYYKTQKEVQEAAEKKKAAPKPKPKPKAQPKKETAPAKPSDSKISSVVDKIAPDSRGWEWDGDSVTVYFRDATKVKNSVWNKLDKKLGALGVRDVMIAST